ncbi:hypothetical protein DWH40_004653 [Escherichia coli]|nr:hypothetical protein [Escherichia coli]
MILVKIIRGFISAERVFVRCDFLVPFFDITSGWGIINPLVSAPDGFVPEGTTAAWRLQIVVWQNMSFQSNHPE